MKAPGSPGDLHSKLPGLSTGEDEGIPGVAVKCVDIRRNTGGEGGPLGQLLTLKRDSVGSKQD